eukprot:6824818-Pyramimonas_sp.AAC.1
MTARHHIGSEPGVPVFSNASSGNSGHYGICRQGFTAMRPVRPKCGETLPHAAFMGSSTLHRCALRTSLPHKPSPSDSKRNANGYVFRIDHPNPCVAIPITIRMVMIWIVTVRVVTPLEFEC